MSSTNVHSEQVENEIFEFDICGGYTRTDGEKIEIPPEGAKRIQTHNKDLENEKDYMSIKAYSTEKTKQEKSTTRKPRAKISDDKENR